MLMFIAIKILYQFNVIPYDAYILNTCYIKKIKIHVKNFTNIKIYLSIPWKERRIHHFSYYNSNHIFLYLSFVGGKNTNLKSLKYKE